MQARVHACYLYPVKACGALEVEALHFDTDGHIEGDREWLVVDEKENSVTWQGAFPRLARLRPLLRGGCLHLSTPEGDTYALPEPGAPREVNWWNDAAKAIETLQARDAGDAAADFISVAAGARLRLVHTAQTRHRPNAVHICTLPSWRELAEAHGDAANASFERMRPNLLLDGDELLPFVEEHCRALTAAGASLSVQERCVRCIVPNVEPGEGQVDERWLAAATRLSAQRHPNAPVAFGVYARPLGAGQLDRGERVSLTLAFD